MSLEIKYALINFSHFNNIIFMQALFSFHISQLTTKTQVSFYHSSLLLRNEYQLTISVHPRDMGITTPFRLTLETWVL